MGTWSTTEPTNVVGWSTDIAGDWVNMYNKGKYGYAYQSRCAVTRLSDNSICVRIKMYSNAIMGWGPANKATYIPWGNDGTKNEFGPSGKYNYGSGAYLAATYYYTLPSSYKGTTVTAGMTCGLRPTNANSPVTLIVPEEVIINKTYIKVNDIWKLANNVYTKVNNVWTKGTAQSKDDGIWKM